jgi:hypothetical protein
MKIFKYLGKTATSGNVIYAEIKEHFKLREYLLPFLSEYFNFPFLLYRGTGLPTGLCECKTWYLVSQYSILY